MEIKKALLTSFLSLLLVLLLVEGILRVAGFSYYWAVFQLPHEQLGWLPLAETSSRQDDEGHAEVVVNQEGFRGADINPKSAEIYRILVLGDSFTEAVQVELEQTWWHQLPQPLQHCLPFKPRSVEVVNAAVSGFSTAQSLRVLQAFGEAYQPDLVLLMFFQGNDVLENSPQLDDNPMRPYLVENVLGDWVWDEGFRTSVPYRLRNAWPGQFYYHYIARSRVVQLLRKVLDKVRLMSTQRNKADWPESGVHPEVYRPLPGKDWLQSWRATEELLRQFNLTTTKLGAEFRVVTASTGFQVQPSVEARQQYANWLGVVDLFYPDWRVARLGEKHGFGVLNLAPAMAESASLQGLHYHGFENSRPDVGHWNATGHAAVTDLVTSYLCEEN